MVGLVHLVRDLEVELFFFVSCFAIVLGVMSTTYTGKNMLYWTTEEKRIRHQLAKVKTYPRWRNWAGGSLYWVHPDLWAEEVFRCDDGTWLVGYVPEGTRRIFETLPEALKYAEELAAPVVLQYRADQKRIRRMWLKETRLAGAAFVDAQLPGITMTRIT
jgi:hypothetical protein